MHPLPPLTATELLSSTALRDWSTQAPMLVINVHTYSSRILSLLLPLSFYSIYTANFAAFPTLSGLLSIDPDIWPLYLLFSGRNWAKMFNTIFSLNMCYQPTSIFSISISPCSGGFLNCWRQSKGYSNHVFSRLFFSFFDSHHLVSDCFSHMASQKCFTSFVRKIQCDVWDRKEALAIAAKCSILFSFRKVIRQLAWPSATGANAVSALWLPVLALPPALVVFFSSHEYNSLPTLRAWRRFISSVSCSFWIKYFKQRIDKKEDWGQWWIPTSVLTVMSPSQSRTSALGERDHSYHDIFVINCNVHCSVIEAFFFMKDVTEMKKSSLSSLTIILTFW